MKNIIFLYLFLFANFNLFSQITQQPASKSICIGGNSQIYLIDTFQNSNYQWQKWNGVAFDNLINSLHYSGVNNDTLFFENVDININNGIYRCLIDTNFTQAEISNNITITILTNSIEPNSILYSINPVNCPGDSTTLKLNGGKLGSNAQWEWYSNTCGNKLEGIGDSITISPDKTKSYFVRAIGGCLTTKCINTLIVVNYSNSVIPDKILASSNPICSSSSTQLNVLGGSLGSNSNWYWYKDSCSSNSIDSGSSIIITPKEGKTTYFVRAKGTCNSTNCISTTIQVNKKPIIQAFDTAICFGSKITLLPTITGNFTEYLYDWSPTIFIDNKNSSKPIVYPQVSSDFRLNIIDSNNCEATNVFRIIVNPLPKINTGGDTSICHGDTILLNPNSGPLTFKWSPSIGLSDSTIRNPKAFPINNTYYNLTVTDSITKCENNQFKKIKVDSLPNIKINAVDTICSGDITQLIAEGGMLYNWFPSSYLDIPNISHPKARPPSTMLYKVKVTNLRGCSAISSVLINVDSIPKLNNKSDTICFADTINLSANNNMKSYQWFDFQTKKVISMNRTFEVNPITNSVYGLTITDFNNCQNSANFEIIVNSNPIAKAGTDICICLDSSVKLNAVGGIKYLWYNTKSLDSLYIYNPTASPKETETFIVKVTNQFGCSSVDSIKIDVFKSPKPSILSNDSIVCKNTQWSKYQVENKKNKYNWEVQNGNIQNGQGTNQIFVKWANQDSVGKVTITESYNIEGMACPIKDSIKVKITNAYSPEPVIILSKANNIETKILLCYQCPYSIYKWGYDYKVNFTSYEETECNGSTWCKFASLDTTNKYYWVKAGNDEQCLTKSYLIGPHLLGTEHPASELPNISIYPNPTNDNLYFEGDFEIISVSIFNLFGQRIELDRLHENLSNKKISLTILENGIYFLNLNTSKGTITKKIIKY